MTYPNYLTIALAAGLMAIPAASNDITAKDYYSGQTITVLVPVSPGGTAPPSQKHGAEDLSGPKTADKVAINGLT